MKSPKRPRTGPIVEPDVLLAQATIQQLPDVVLWVGPDGVIKHANGAVDRLGYAPKDLVGRSLFELVPEAERSSFSRLQDRVAGVITFEATVRCSDGTVVPVSATASIVRLGPKEYACTFLRDLPRREGLEQTVREREQQYRHLVEMANDGIIIVQDEIVQYINPRFTSIFGISPGCQIRFRDLLHPDAVDDAMKRYRRHIEGKDMPLMYESMLLHEGGHTVPVEFNVGQIPWHGKPALIYEIRDITERKRAEVELRDALHLVEGLKKRLEEENVYLQHEIKLTHNFEDIISQDKRFKDLLGEVEMVASTNATVMILGETGTGKELIARAIHGISPRADRPLVKVNCAALPASLIESELFGYERGAFTGAVACRKGRFELADGGTIFLDEIGDLPPDLQVKLLRVLQDGEFERLGGTETLKVDVRVIAATNRDLESAVSSGTFREDLFYRLNVVPIVLPPLRNRAGDIPLLVNHFVRRFTAKTGKKIRGVPKKVMEFLKQYDWPGNVRELENIVERAVILSPGDQLEIGEWFGRARQPSSAPPQTTLEELERAHITRVLARTGWRVSGEKGAAKILGINPQTLVSRMKRLGIRRPVF